MKPAKLGIHVLTAFPPSNPNRDETGQPKSAVVGGVLRQRISSQCIKRSWRLSDPMRALGDKFATRTRQLGVEVERILTGAGVPPDKAREWATAVAEKFGKIEKKKAPSHSEMVVIGREEWEGAMELARKLGADKRAPKKDELDQLPRDTVSIDVALFGRMRAADPSLNVDAAVSVSHPLTTGKATMEADFWTSVDDLKQRDEDADRGSGGMGEVEYGAGVYYTYVEAALAALAKNLGGGPEAKESLLKEVVGNLIVAIATSCPGGHRSSFGNIVRASYMRAEVGQPSGNLFCAAFEKPVVETEAAIKALGKAADREEKAYGLERTVVELSVPGEKGTLAELVSKVKEALG
jgi:CRISPR system Cascade subunit CasC